MKVVIELTTEEAVRLKTELKKSADALHEKFEQGTHKQAHWLAQWNTVTDVMSQIDKGLDV